jgi:hypothetical protein
MGRWGDWETGRLRAINDILTFAAQDLDRCENKDISILFEILTVTLTCRGGASCPPSRDFSFRIAIVQYSYNIWLVRKT